jgi:hypothetical protein
MKRGILCLLIGCTSLTTAVANDAGDLLFPADYPHKVRYEILFQHNERNLDITPASPRRAYDYNADAYIVRLQTRLNPYARIDFDLGAVGANSGSHSLVGGIGARLLAFEQNAWRGGAFAHVRYAPDMNNRIDLLDQPQARASFDQVEVDGGFLVSYRQRLAAELNVAPYGGIMASIVRLSGTAGVDVDGNPARFRAEQEDILGIVLGVGLHFRDMNGIRFEIRYTGDVSYTLAAALVF